MVDPSSPFYVKGKLTVANSATVICARQRPGAPVKLSPESISNLNASFASVFQNTPYEFSSGWEVLVGQSEVINYLKSTPGKLKTMRYGGEFKLAGGNVDDGETLEDCAVRELQEEFLNPLKQNVTKDEIILRPFNLKQTRPIRSRSNLMHNFIALEKDNPWLKQLDVDKVNEGLRRRRNKFKQMVESGEYWKMSTAEKELLSPEVHQLEWVPLSTAFRRCMESMVPGIYVNDFQKDQFKLLGKKRRDPMFMTGATLVELEAFANEEQLIRWGEKIDWEYLRKGEQWLFNGMDNDQVEDVLAERAAKSKSINPSFRSPSGIQSLKTEVRSITSKL